MTTAAERGNGDSSLASDDSDFEATAKTRVDGVALTENVSDSIADRELFA